MAADVLSRGVCRRREFFGWVTANMARDEEMLRERAEKIERVARERARQLNSLREDRANRKKVRLFSVAARDSR
jgi:hypothetical protein